MALSHASDGLYVQGHEGIQLDLRDLQKEKTMETDVSIVWQRPSTVSDSHATAHNERQVSLTSTESQCRQTLPSPVSRERSIGMKASQSYSPGSVKASNHLALSTANIASIEEENHLPSPKES